MNQAVGYRFWRPDNRWLVSPFCPTVWPQATRLKAACRDEPAGSPQGRRPKAHQQDPGAVPPVPGCACGIYAYHDVATMQQALHEPLIGGAVLCWGRITIHPEGIRAQFARPLALTLPEPWRTPDWTRSELRAIAAGYGIPVLESQYLESYASEFGDSFRPTDTPTPATRSFGSVMRRLLKRLIDV